ncbi:MAG TPA: LuxR C-terminal-related transcriptional regulator [Leptolyngbya sp.]|jgi:DNA-binding CsgD family transcriptional regulator|nr:LuxR C-terminal-related transcriptional regulator [Leptolyngbya sp.]
MVVPLFSVHSDLQRSSWSNHAAQKRSSRRSRRNNLNTVRQEVSAPSAAAPNQDLLSQDAFWGVLLESMSIGVMVLATSLQRVYCNEKANAFCERLQNLEDALPIAVKDLCQRLMQEEMASIEPLIMEYQGDSEFFRLQVRWMNLATTQPLLLVFLEDCHESLRTELEIEQDKYDLTDRETEIWFLLRQEYSYQEISNLLKISLNTVKTHVKNIYAKRKSLAEERKIWYSR